MRRIPILTISQSGTNPGFFQVGATDDNSSGDWTSVFQGKYYRNSAGSTVPFYTAPVPTGYTLIQATTFSVIQNASYAGRYTVYTKPSAGGLDSSEVVPGNRTLIRVNEPIGAPLAPADAAPAGNSFITNVSTYYIAVPPSSPVIVPPETIIETSAFDLPGRNFSGWGEVILQNMARQIQSYAGSTPPSNPLVGQLWFNTTSEDLRIWDGTAWMTPIGSGIFAPFSSFRHTQTPSATTWTVNHNLGLSSPFIAHVSCFSNEPGGVKAILPSDITFVSANQLTVTFSSAKSGYVLVRA